MRRKRLLIVTDTFLPFFCPRMGYLCKNLCGEWDITVVSEKMDESKSAKFEIPIGNTETYSIPFLRNKHKVLASMEWAVKFALTLLFDYKSRYYYRKVVKRYGGKQFDVVLCSAYSTFPLKVAERLAKHYGNIPLVVDLRDVVEELAGMSSYQAHHVGGWLGRIMTRLVNGTNIRRRNEVIKHANAVTTVSQWQVDFLRPLNGNIHLIYNGYDEERFQPDETVKSDCFKIVYTGRLVDFEVRNPRLLFEALRRMKGKKIEVEWWSEKEIEARLMALAADYGVKEMMRFRGYVAHKDMPRVLNDASVVLVLTNRTETLQPRGVLPTKFFEAVGCERPVLSVKSDEAELAGRIRALGAGASCSDVEEVVRFLLEKYAEWEQFGRTKVKYHCDKSLYSRVYQAKQFGEILESCCPS